MLNLVMVESYENLETAYPEAGRPARAVLWLMGVLAAVALGGSAFLLYESLAAGQPLPGCGPGSGCDAVLNSRWSRWLGVPVAGPAALLYAVMLGSTFVLGGRSTPRRMAAWMLLIMGGAMAIGAAGWFISVQALWVGAWCKYCLVVHVSGVLLGVLVFATAPIGRTRPGSVGPPAAILGLLVAMVGVGVLAAGQLMVSPAMTRVVELREGASVEIDPAGLPHVGDATAQVVVLYLFDYTCPHCRRMHGHLAEAVARYEGQLAVVALVSPLHPDCNPVIDYLGPMQEHGCDLAKLSLAVWRAGQERWGEFHTWLFDSDAPREPIEARAKAAELVGEAALAEALADPWVAEQLARNVAMYGMTEVDRLPQLVVGNEVIAGRPESAEALMALLEERTVLEEARATGE